MRYRDVILWFFIFSSLKVSLFVFSSLSPFVSIDYDAGDNDIIISILILIFIIIIKFFFLGFNYVRGPC